MLELFSFQMVTFTLKAFTRSDRCRRNKIKLETPKKLLVNRLYFYFFCAYYFKHQITLANYIVSIHCFQRPPFRFVFLLWSELYKAHIPLDKRVFNCFFFFFFFCFFYSTKINVVDTDKKSLAKALRNTSKNKPQHKNHVTGKEPL